MAEQVARQGQDPGPVSSPNEAPIGAASRAIKFEDPSDNPPTPKTSAASNSSAPDLSIAAPPPLNLKKAGLAPGRGNCHLTSPTTPTMGRLQVSQRSVHLFASHFCLLAHCFFLILSFSNCLLPYVYLSCSFVILSLFIHSLYLLSFFTR